MKGTASVLTVTLFLAASAISAGAAAPAVPQPSMQQAMLAATRHDLAPRHARRE
jgi:hypothetical protein